LPLKQSTAAPVHSIVIRLFGTAKFVDRAQNSIVPPSNEFGLQLLEKASGFLPKPAVGRQESRFSLFFARMLTRYMSAGELAGGRT
jgi:hypothetical protein